MLDEYFSCGDAAKLIDAEIRTAQTKEREDMIEAMIVVGISNQKAILVVNKLIENKKGSK